MADTLGLIFMAVILILSLLATGAFLYAIYEVVVSDRPMEKKLLWLLVILFVPAGFIFYFLLRDA